MEQNNLWVQVANKCLSRALDILNNPNENCLFDVDDIQKLVQIAIDIDKNFQPKQLPYRPMPITFQE